MNGHVLNDAVHGAPILVVDDRAANVEMVTGLLDVGGYSNVKGTTDPKQGLAMAEWGSFDLILLDMRMPEIDGPEFIRRLKACDLKEQPAILVLTAQTDEETRRAALSAGARDFLIKPFKLWELLQRVHNTLEIQILYRQARAINEVLEARVQQRTHELTIANRAKSEFLANMSHELRTPLNAILGFSQIIADRLLGADALDRYVTYAADIQSSGRNLLKIVDDVFDLSKIEAGHGALDEAEISADSLLDAAVRLNFADQFRQAGLRLSVEIPEPYPLLYVDAGKMKQALGNLLSNALKFTQPGGTVMVAVVPDTDGGLGFSVSDTGKGIAPADIERVLSLFGQVESAFSRHHHGAGLGLPLARALIELHGGRLVLTSEIERGTTVTLWLPRDRIVGRLTASGQPFREPRSL